MDMPSSDSPKYQFTVPPALQKREGGLEIKTITIRELSPDDELQATQRAKGDAIRLAFELALQSLCQVNGTAVSLVDGTSERMWRAIGPQLRNLVVSAYSSQFMATQDDAALFLSSRKLST